jgi:2-dehydro-3-deoxyphosphogluconate aldolase/(4S)-4-hydroxy-2-oxoglutarate aldolase
MYDPTTERGQWRAKLKDLLRKAVIIPVVTIDRMADAVPLAEALVAGGIHAIEITLRTPVAFEAARAIMREVPSTIVGIGTILTREDLGRARDLGAAFALSPGTTPALLEAAAETDLAFVPGVQTASEVMAAMAAGFEILKFFPAVPAGGIAGLRALAGPFPKAGFCPTGGIGEKDLSAWLSEPNVLAVGGSWIAPAKDIAAGSWPEITARAAQVSKLIKTEQ